LALLDELRSSFASMDDLRTNNGQSQRLIIAGTGFGTPDPDTLEGAWQLLTELHQLLSKPIGLGLVMSYIYDGNFFGFDVFNKLTLPSQLARTGDVRGAVLTPAGDVLAYSDDDGLNVFDLQTQSKTQLLPPPEDGYYLPRTWANTGRLMVSHYPESEDEPIQHGWITLEDGTWNDLPTPEGVRGYGCDTGPDWSPEGDELAVTGLGYGEPCNINPGLTVIDVSSNTAQVIVAPTINSIEQESGTLIAGAHTPAWSPDGTWIAFGLDQDITEAGTFPTRLYRVHPDGSNLTPLTSNSQGQATHPVWAQDGSLYYGLSGAGADLDGLYNYLPAENTHKLLLPGAGVHPLSISPDGEFLLFEQDQVLRIWQVRLLETVAEVIGEEGIHPSFSGWITIERDR
jgi:WD40 repeat protein